jgi:hypothetical protein
MYPEHMTSRPGITGLLDAHNCGIVEPAVLHQVKPLDKVRFYVEFYRLQQAEPI